MSEMKTNLILILTMFLIGMCVTGGTYAYWTWNSTSSQTKNVIFNVGNLSEHVKYSEGLSHFVGDFKPSTNFCGGISNTISFYKTEIAKDTKIVATINMSVNRIESPIANSDYVYWVLTKGDNNLSSNVCSSNLNGSVVISSGIFKNVTAGSSLVLSTDLIVPVEPTEDKYTIWIWIDSNGSNLTSLSGMTLDTNIWTQFDLVDSEG